MEKFAKADELDLDSAAIESEIEVLKSLKSTADTTASLGFSGDVYQNVFAFFEKNSFIDQDDFLAFFFDVDVPVKGISEGTIIYQYATLKPKVATTTAGNTTKQRTIVCKTVVGLAQGTEVNLYEGTEDFKTAGQTGKKYDEHTSTDLGKSAVKFDKENEDFYAL